jgi:hypothetical protein
VCVGSEKKNTPPHGGVFIVRTVRKNNEYYCSNG